MLDLNSENNWKALPRAFACLGVFLLSFVLLGITFIFLNSRPHTTETVGVPGNRINRPYWFMGLDPAQAVKVSMKSSGVFDGHATWVRAEINAANAKTWQEKLHALPDSKFDKDLNPNEMREWVRFEIAGPHPVHGELFSPPDWWKPPQLTFLATQSIKWYDDGNSGYGNAVYSAYDKSSQTVWIYEFGQQHYLFWKKGELPEGIRFTQAGRPLITPKAVKP